MQAKITRLTNVSNSKYKVDHLMRFPLGMNKQFVEQTSFFKYKVTIDFKWYTKLDRWMIHFIMETYIKILDVIENGF